MAADDTALPRAGGGAHRGAWHSLLLAPSADAQSQNVSRKGGNRLSVPAAELALFILWLVRWEGSAWRRHVLWWALVRTWRSVCISCCGDLRCVLRYLCAGTL